MPSALPLRPETGDADVIMIDNAMESFPDGSNDVGEFTVSFICNTRSQAAKPREVMIIFFRCCPLPGWHLAHCANGVGGCREKLCCFEDIAINGRRLTLMRLLHQPLRPSSPRVTICANSSKENSGLRKRLLIIMKAKLN